VQTGPVLKDVLQDPLRVRADMLDIMIVDGRDIGKTDVIGRDQHGSGSNLRLEGSGGAECDNPFNTTDRECRQIRPVIDPVGREPVLVSHEHHDVAKEDLSRAKWRTYRSLFQRGKRRV
jgi:hypothetical protein